MDFGLRGKVAVVAGGARGCGRAIAEELAREGARVAISSRDKAALEICIAELAAKGLEVLPLEGRMDDEAQASAWFDKVRTAWGDPEILVVNPAGPATRSHGFESTSNADFAVAGSHWIMPIVHLVREALPAMKSRGWGRVVSIGSVSLKVPHLDDPLYSANVRVGAAAMIKTLSHEYGKYGITFNTIATGPFRTGASEAYVSDPESYREQELLKMTAIGRWGRPEEMGAVVAFLCSVRASWVTGETIRVDGGYAHSLF